VRAGLLRQRVILKAPTETLDAAGQSVITYPTDTATVWARVEPLTGRELKEAGAFASEATLKVIIRYCSGLTSKYIIVHGTRTYKIEAVLNLMIGRKDIKLLCTELPASAV